MRIALMGVLCICSLLCGCIGPWRLDLNANDYDNEKVLVRDGGKYSYWDKDGKADSKEADMNFYFSGNDVIWKIDSKKETDIQCFYNINITSGQFKVVEITEDKKVILLWENDSGMEEGDFSIQLKEGVSRIKIVGNKAKGHATLSLSDNPDVAVEAISYSKG